MLRSSQGGLSSGTFDIRGLVIHDFSGYATSILVRLSRFEANRVLSDGGGIYNAPGAAATVSQSTFQGNWVRFFGGAVQNHGSLLPSAQQGRQTAPAASAC